MSKTRIKILNKIEEMNEPIILHFIKDLNGWIRKVLKRAKNEKFNNSQYLNSLFNYDFNKTKKLIAGKDFIGYGQCKVLRTDDEVFEKLKKIYPKLCRDIGNKVFENIEDYFKN